MDESHNIIPRKRIQTQKNADIWVHLWDSETAQLVKLICVVRSKKNVYSYVEKWVKIGA